MTVPPSVACNDVAGVKRYSTVAVRYLALRVSLLQALSMRYGGIADGARRPMRCEYFPFRSSKTPSQDAKHASHIASEIPCIKLTSAARVAEVADYLRSLA